MTEIILYCTPKRASAVQRRVRSTESYALVRSIKYTYSGFRFFRANSCKRFGRKPLCSSGRIVARADQAQFSKIYCHKRHMNLARRKVCSVYHVLRKCTRGDSAFYLHRAGPGVMGHRRCLKGYDRASNICVWSSHIAEYGSTG